MSGYGKQYGPRFQRASALFLCHSILEFSPRCSRSGSSVMSFPCSKPTRCCQRCSPTRPGLKTLLIGAAASLVAWKLAKPRYRNGFAAWQFLGVADLVLAVGTGTLSGLVEPPVFRCCR
jgi:hypothetical protein